MYVAVAGFTILTTTTETFPKQSYVSSLLFCPIPSPDFSLKFPKVTDKSGKCIRLTTHKSVRFSNVKMDELKRKKIIKKKCWWKVAKFWGGWSEGSGLVDQPRFWEYLLWLPSGGVSLSEPDKILALTHHQYNFSCLEAWQAQMASLDPVFSFRKQHECRGRSKT